MADLEQLFTIACAARENAYAPYSKFAVGAAIWSADGTIYAGCNVENVSFPCGTCAEAGALAAMNVAGCRKLTDIVVVADSQNLITPCGACLQRIAEFADAQTMVHLANLSGIVKSVRLFDLIPAAFHEEGLCHD